MSKNITRTISIYTYTTAKVNTVTCQIEDVKDHSFPYKLNERQKRALVKEAGNPIVGESTGESLYSMSIEEFIKYATPVIGKESDDAE